MFYVSIGFQCQLSVFSQVGLGLVSFLKSFCFRIVCVRYILG